jgi:hypothetical protein
LGLQNYAVIMPIEHTSVKYNKNETLHKVTEFYTVVQRLSQKISKVRTTAIIKGYVKENDSDKTCRYVHERSLYKTSFVQVQLFMSCLCRIKCEFYISTARLGSYFWFFVKVVPLKAVRHLKI